MTALSIAAAKLGKIIIWRNSMLLGKYYEGMGSSDWMKKPYPHNIKPILS